MVDIANEVAAVVIDNGSGSVKAGFAGEDAPRVYFPTIVGKPRMPGMVIGMDQRDTYVGHDAWAKRGVLSLSYPIQEGRVASWEEMEKVWHHTFYNELKVPPEEHPLLMTDAPMTSRAEREKMIRTVFEVFNAPSFYVATTSVLALYATGRTTGVVLDSGEGATHSVPVFEGYAMPHSIMKCDVAGKDLTLFLWKLLKEAGYSFSLAQEREIIRNIKEKTCRISMNFDKEFKEFSETMTKDVSYELPDKSIIKIGSPQILCPEALFQPSKLGKTSPGIDEIIYQSVTMSDGDLRKDFYANIILAGGSTLFPNLDLRLAEGLRKLSKGLDIKTPAFPERGFTTWIGGSILSSLSTFQSMRITKAEYEEHQEKIVHKKCF